MSKLPNVTPSIFAVMSKMAMEHQAINLAQGFPNFAVDDTLAQIVSEVVKKDVHQYQLISGYPPLLNKIADLIQDYYQRKVSPETEILITAGATQALFTTILALIKKGEEVIILDPSFDNYEAPTLLCDAKAIRVELNDDYSPNWERIEKHITSKTRMLIINSPHNPSGKMWKENDFIALENLLEKHPNLLLLSDEAESSSKAQLKIWADDVKCSHGATVGQLDKDAMFYLRSRGITKKEAEAILITAFARDILDPIKNEAFKIEIEAKILAKLSLQ